MRGASEPSNQTTATREAKMMNLVLRSAQRKIAARPAVLVTATLAVIFIAATGQTTRAQQLGTTDWSQGVRWDNSDPTNPYYLEPDTGIVWAGSATSQADAVMNADASRLDFGVSGAGIKIGVISDSYNALGGEAAGIASGDLPGAGNPNGFLSPVNVVKDEAPGFGTDEGRAMVELIHDLAPGAEILFHSAFNTPGSTGAPPSTTIANAIDALRLAGADIIVDDVAILTAAKYQDGAAAQAVDRAFAAGIPYFSSAGNNGNNAYEANHQSSIPATGFNDLHEFSTTGGLNQILDLGTLDPGEDFRAVLRWDDPFASLGGAGTTDYLLGAAVFDQSGTFLGVLEADQDQQAGADAFEFLSATNNGPDPLDVGLVVDRVAGNEATLLSLEVFGLDISDVDDTNSPTIQGHNAAKGAIAVAAQFYADPGLNDVEPFSSVGPTRILFDADGSPLDEPEFRATPQLTGIDGTDTTFFPAGGFDVEGNGFPNFFGTSAAAPHVAAVSALVLERADDLGVTLTPSQLYELLFASTIDIESPGFDNLSGFGRLDASLALANVVPEPSSVAIASLALSVWLTRRRLL